MPEIRIAINNKIPQVLDSTAIICGNADYKIRFIFDAEWNGYTTKTVTYTFYSRVSGSYNKVNVMFRGDSVDVPALPTTTLLRVMVYAGDIYTTTDASIICTGESEVHNVPSTDLYEQLLEHLANLQISSTGIAEINLIGSDTSEIGIAEEEE